MELTYLIMIFLYTVYADDTPFFLKVLDSVKTFRNAELILYGIGTTS